MLDKQVILYWIRRDLRISDNPALSEAVNSGALVVPVFIYDEWFSELGAAPKFRLEKSLLSLQKQYEGLGSYLLIKKGPAGCILHDLIKETIQRFRPSHHLEVSKHLNFVNEYKGGMFGFVSNHATNMSIVGIMIFNVIKNSYPKSWIYLLIFVVLISYSRIYLGVHYLSDIIGGWILGIILSLSNYQLIKKTILKS